MKTFNESLYHNLSNDLFVNAVYSGELFGYLRRNNIHQRKDRIKVFKSWFLSGKHLYVNGSASGRVVLKYHPELLHLLKVGFIKQVRQKRYRNIRCNQTILVLNQDKSKLYE